MMYTAKNPPQQDVLETDVVIIGSGCGGAIAAATLSTQGKRVILLEEGPYVTQKDLNQDAGKLVPKMYRRAAGLATDDMSMRILQGRVWGGSTTINWMTCLRTPDFVLDQWVDQFGLSNYSPMDMKPHFEKVEKRLSVHDIADTDHSPQNRIILDGCKELGIHGVASQNNSIDCIGCGTCGLGCPYNAKQDMRLTYLKDALNNGITVLTDTRADKIKYHSENNQEVLATIYDKENGIGRYKIKVKSVNTIVSAGAIYTPLILQNSGLTKGGLVGKHLQVHPVTAAFAKYDRIIDPTYGIPQTTYSEEYHNLDGNGYGFWLEVPDLEPFLIAVNYPGLGSERRDDLKQLRHFGAIIILVRDGANGKSTISNGEVRWRRGFNFHNGSFNIKKVPSIRYRLSKEDKHHLMKGLENSIEIHFAAGAKEVLTLHNHKNVIKSVSDIPNMYKLPNGPNQLSLFSAHPTGTARMGVNPKLSVVNERLEMHHYPGVFVMDGSILPTAPGVNPMISILSTISRAFSLSDN